MIFGDPVGEETVSAVFTEVAVLDLRALRAAMEACAALRRRRSASYDHFRAELLQFDKEAAMTAATAGNAAGSNAAFAVGTGATADVSSPIGTATRRPFGAASGHLSLAAVAPAPVPVPVPAAALPSDTTAPTPATSYLGYPNQDHNCRFESGIGCSPTPSIYRQSLLATVAAYRVQAKRMSKTQTSLSSALTSATHKKKNLTEMMELTTLPELAGWRGGCWSKISIVQPCARFHFVWSLLLAAGVVYYSLAVPLRIMVHFHCGAAAEEGGGGTGDRDTDVGRNCLSTAWDFSLIVDYLVDALIVCEVLLRSYCYAFRRYEGAQDVVESDREAIWKRFYGSYRFYILLWLAIPFDFLALKTGFLLCWRLVKLVSTALLTTIVKDVQSWLDKERSR